MARYQHEVEEHRLYRLGDLDDYEVADWDPDIRGWDVLDSHGVKVGRVNELIVDPEAEKVRYLDLELDRELLGSGNARNTLVPIGLAVLNEKDGNVLLGRIDREALVRAPAYTGDEVLREYETALRGAYTPAGARAPATTGDFYEHEMYDVGRFHGRPNRDRT